MIEADSIVGDIVHVMDLFTSLVRFACATERIPTDRIIDGVDQTALMLVGETHGRRDQQADVPADQPVRGAGPEQSPHYPLRRHLHHPGALLVSIRQGTCKGHARFALVLGLPRPHNITGTGVKSQTVHRRVHSVDVAPTIAALLGMTPPGSAQGSPLEEVFH